MIEFNQKSNTLEQTDFKYTLQDVAEPNLYRDMFNYEEIPKCTFNHRKVPMYPPDDIWITDTTFRDGQQARAPYTVEQIVTLFDFMHRLGGLEKDYTTSAISTDPVNHQKMVDARKAKIQNVVADVPDLRVLGDPSADLLAVSWGGTFGHMMEAVNEMNRAGKKVALAHFSYLNPLPKNTEEVLKKYKKIVVCELNDGQLAGYLRMKIDGLNHLEKYNKVQGQPFKVAELTECFTKLLEK